MDKIKLNGEEWTELTADQVATVLVDYRTKIKKNYPDERLYLRENLDGDQGAYILGHSWFKNAHKDDIDYAFGIALSWGQIRKYIDTATDDIDENRQLEMSIHYSDNCQETIGFLFETKDQGGE